MSGWLHIRHPGDPGNGKAMQLNVPRPGSLAKREYRNLRSVLSSAKTIMTTDDDNDDDHEDRSDQRKMTRLDINDSPADHLRTENSELPIIFHMVAEQAQSPLLPSPTTGQNNDTIDPSSPASSSFSLGYSTSQLTTSHFLFNILIHMNYQTICGHRRQVHQEDIQQKHLMINSTGFMDAITDLIFNKFVRHRLRTLIRLPLRQPSP